MDKQQIISFIQRQLEEGRITKDEVNQILNQGQVSSGSSTLVTESKDNHTKSLTNIFYGIGAIIVVIGVVILIAQNWTEIGFVGRIGVTLGLALIAYSAGFLLMNHEQKILSPLSFVISAIFFPLGSYVLCDEFGIDFSITTQITITTIIAILFLNALLITKKNILILVSIGYATWLYFLIFAKLLAEGYIEETLIKWAIMFIGFAYLLISYGLSGLQNTLENMKEIKSVQRVLYIFGTLGVLASGMAVGGFFDLILIVIIFAFFYLSIYLKSTEMLGLAALFLMAHIIKLTAEYFEDVISWPIALIGVGFMIISIGYATFHINKKFISQK